MSNRKFLLKNIGLLTISQFSSKILSFLLVPLYTSVLSTEEYGIYGIYSTTISLLVPILTLNLSEAALRFALDRKYDKRKICSFCLIDIIGSSVLVGSFVYINSITHWISFLAQFGVYFALMFVTTALNCFVMAFARGLEKIKSLAISGFIGTAGVLGFNLYFLLVLELGLEGYFLANILGTTVQLIYLIFSIRLWRYFSFGNKVGEYKKDLIKYSLPLVGNSVSWWVNDASDRYIVTWICGVAENGIYSVGYKIPSILNALQSIFNQAWTLSAVKEFESEKKEDFFSEMYMLYSFLMTMVCSFLIAFDKILAHILYLSDFYEAWRYVPILLIATLFGALSGYLGGIFAAVKETKAYATSTIIGALSNIVLNCVLIKEFGTIGAAIATLMANVLIWVLRYVKTKEYITLNVRMKCCVLSYSLLIVQTAFLLLVDDYAINACLAILIFGIILVLHWKEVQMSWLFLLKILRTAKNGGRKYLQRK